MCSTPIHWMSAAGAPLPAAGEIHVWRVDLHGAPAAAETLSAEEQHRAAAFKFAADRHAFLGRRIALRRLLSGYTGCAPEAIAYRANPHGKPALSGPADCPLEFNLSRSGSLALVGVTVARPLGVDLEGHRPLPEAEELIRHYFAPDEQAEWLKLPEASRWVSFYDIWARKEAVIKALGRGLSQPLDSFTVPVNHEPGRTAITLEGKWTLLPLDVAPAFSAALVQAGEPAAVRGFDFQW
jgi:4'-phosphopantetheinyl transferase